MLLYITLLMEKVIIMKLKINQEEINFLPLQVLITILFSILKLTNVIDWSWVWVISPMWIPTATALGLITLVAVPTTIIARITYLIAKRKYRKSKQKTNNYDFNFENNKTYEDREDRKQKTRFNSIREEIEKLKREREFLEYCNENDLDPKVYQMSKSYKNFTKKGN